MHLQAFGLTWQSAHRLAFARKSRLQSLRLILFFSVSFVPSGTMGFPFLHLICPHPRGGAYDAVRARLVFGSRARLVFGSGVDTRV